MVGAGLHTTVLAIIHYNSILATGVVLVVESLAVCHTRVSVVHGGQVCINCRYLLDCNAWCYAMVLFATVLYLPSFFLCACGEKLEAEELELLDFIVTSMSASVKRIGQ